MIKPTKKVPPLSYGKARMDDINTNRHLVQSIFTWLGDAQDTNEIFILRQLVREELQSLEQFEQHAELE